MRRPSEKTKQDRGYGTGHGADYKPYIKAREFNSSGTCSTIIDWKHGRTIELRSQGEKWWYYILRWDDDALDIREQFPLPIEETTEIAMLKGYNPVQRGKVHMTTDMLVDYSNGKKVAYSVKARKNHSKRALEKMDIEKTYWEGQGVEFKVLYKDEVDLMKAINISNLVMFYKPESLRPGHRIDLLRHLIITKQLPVNLSEELDYDKIGETYGITG